MGWEVSYNHAFHFVEILLTDQMDTSDLDKLTSETIKVSLEHGCTDFLLDSKEEIWMQSMVDLYRLPQTYASRGLSLKSRAAVVLSKTLKMRDYQKFWETVCVNLGWEVKSFENREASGQMAKGQGIL